MKKILLLALVTISANAFDFPKVQRVKPMTEYDLDVKFGYNPSVYEFTPKTAPEKTCIAITKSADNIAITCFDKSKKGEDK